MSSLDIPILGSITICVTLVAAAYTFAVALAAGRGHPRMLSAARFGTYATSAMVLLAICLLGFAFQSHDFRITYVARYSDRTMPWWYLVTSLWGGQDGSLLWWSFLLVGWTAACVRWMRGRFIELQPWVIATLMSILIFFQVVMLFAANPFATSVAAVPPDGEGLNPLLQNYWMTIHPPTLYMGFVGWSVPFAFAIAALITGRLHDEWLRAIRRWVLAAWLCLSVGLLLGMLWSYEELGWGGYWAWDPVENASFLPWLVGTAFLHSTMIQERYGMLKVWNVFLICLTFFMTIFGTFLTRSGLIASVHSFARSDIGIYFVWYMAFLLVGCVALALWRLPMLKAVNRIESLLSREFAFLFNNWIFLAFMGFVLFFTTFPLVSEWLRSEEATIGPVVYNHFFTPLGLILLVLTGVGPLIAWRKATGKNLLRAFAVPAAVAVVAGTLHGIFGGYFGFPAYVHVEPIWDDGWLAVLGRGLAYAAGIAPMLAIAACAFVTATITQEFWRGTVVRMRSKGESAPVALTRLTLRARRRYGGYVVHIAIVLLYVGFTGAAYDVEKEATLRPGEQMEVGDYRFRFDGARMEQDTSKRMLFADMTAMTEDSEPLGSIAPAKFIYSTHPEMPTTEVAIRSRPMHDLYVIMATVDPNTRRGTFRVIVRPFVMWIWIGGLLLIFGTFLAAAPSVREVLEANRPRSGRRSRAMATAAAKAGTGAAVVLLIAAALTATWLPARAAAQSSSAHAGTIIIEDPDERRLFERLLCMCGDCQRLTLASCGCGWADDKRAEIRRRMSNGDAVEVIQATYRAEFGSRAVVVPGDSGIEIAMWAAPAGFAVLAAAGLIFAARRWKRASGAAAAASAADPKRDAKDDAAGGRYGDQLAQELARLEEET